MKWEALNAENLGAQRRLWAKTWQVALKASKPQPESTAEKAFLSYIRQYVHPQATWLDACKLLLEYGCFGKSNAHQPLPWDLLHTIGGFSVPKNDAQEELSQYTWLFHRLPHQGYWTLPPNWAQLLAEGMNRLFPESSVQVLFASTYELPLFQAWQKLGGKSRLLTPHLPNALALAQSMPHSEDKVYWANPWLVPEQAAATPSMFSPNSTWMEALQSLPTQTADWIFINTLQSPTSSFERGNQKLYEEVEGIIHKIFIERDFGEKEPSIPNWVRLMAQALAKAQSGNSAVLALLPDEACWSPAWAKWRGWIQEYFPQQLLLREATGAWTACLLLPKRQSDLPALQWASVTSQPDWSHLPWNEIEPLLESTEAGPSHWNELEWKTLEYSAPTQHWIPQQEAGFFDGIPLFTTSPKEAKPALFLEALPLEAPVNTLINGLNEEEVGNKIEQLTQEERELLPEGRAEQTLLRIGVERYTWLPQDIPSKRGWYWANSPYRVRAVNTPPQYPMLGQEESAVFLPEQQLNPKAVKLFQKHYQPQVEVPTGIATSMLHDWIAQLEKHGRQLPVLQKYTNKLDRFVSENSKKNLLPLKYFDENRELIAQFQQKIQQLYRGANERKSMFQRLLQILSQWESELQNIDKDRQAAIAKQEAVNEENIKPYAYAILSESKYAQRFPIGLQYLPPHLPLYPDFWAWAEKGQSLLNAHLSPTPITSPSWKLFWKENAPASLPVFRLDSEKRQLQVDSELSVQNLPQHCFTPQGKMADWLKSLITVFRRKYLSPWEVETWLRYREQFTEAFAVSVALSP